MLDDDVLIDVETKPVVDASLAVFEAIATSDGRVAKKGILLGLERKGKRTHAVLVAAKSKNFLGWGGWRSSGRQPFFSRRVATECAGIRRRFCASYAPA